MNTNHGEAVVCGADGAERVIGISGASAPSKHAAPQIGHRFETNEGGHRLRRVAKRLARQSPSDTQFEIVQHH
jgi:hypothetical protein